MTLRVAVIGLGDLGRRRAALLEASLAYTLVAVCDKNTWASRELPAAVRRYGDVDVLLNEDLDAVFVCTDNDTAATVTAVLESGKHVFCEKIPALNLAELETILSAEKNAPTKVLRYGFGHRYRQSVLDALRIAQEGRFGKILHVRGAAVKSNPEESNRTAREKSHAREGREALEDRGAVMGDLMRLFAGEYLELHAIFDGILTGEHLEDNVGVLMRSATGILGTLHLATVPWQNRIELEVRFERGTLLLEVAYTGTEECERETLTVTYHDQGRGGWSREETVAYDQDRSRETEIAEFAADIASRTERRRCGTSEVVAALRFVRDIREAGGRIVGQTRETGGSK